MARIRFDFQYSTEWFRDVYDVVVYRGAQVEDDTATQAKRVAANGSYGVFVGEFTTELDPKSGLHVASSGVLQEIHIFSADGALVGTISDINADGAAYVRSVQTDTHAEWWDALTDERGVDVSCSDVDDGFGATSADDRLSGGGGEDILLGRDGDDRIFGGDGADRIDGGAGNDFVKGGRGADLIYGRDGADDLNGGRGNDTIYGGVGRDHLKGDNGNDRLSGGDGDDILRGGKGRDILVGGDGDDRLYGGQNADAFTFVEGLDGGDDVVKDFTDGQDTLALVGYFETFDEVLSASSQTDDGVLVRLDADSTVLLENFNLSNLSAADVVLE